MLWEVGLQNELFDISYISASPNKIFSPCELWFNGASKTSIFIIQGEIIRELLVMFISIDGYIFHLCLYFLSEHRILFSLGLCICLKSCVKGIPSTLTMLPLSADIEITFSFGDLFLVYNSYGYYVRLILSLNG